MMNDERRMMNEINGNGFTAVAGKGHHSSFIIPHLSGGAVG